MNKYTHSMLLNYLLAFFSFAILVLISFIFERVLEIEIFFGAALAATHICIGYLIASLLSSITILRKHGILLFAMLHAAYIFFMMAQIFLFNDEMPVELEKVMFAMYFLFLPVSSYWYMSLLRRAR